MAEISTEEIPPIWDDRYDNPIPHSQYCPTYNGSIPSRYQISQGTDSDLETAYDQWQEGYENACCEDYENRCMQILSWIESEQDARELWNSDDDRIRESVGNYRSHLA